MEKVPELRMIGFERKSIIVCSVDCVSLSDNQLELICSTVDSSLLTASFSSMNLVVAC